MRVGVPLERKNNYFKYKKSIMLFLIGVVALLFAKFYLLKTLMFLFPFITIILLSIALNKIVSILEKKKIPRGIATFVSLLVALSLIIGFFTVIILQLINGSKYLLKLLNAHSGKIINYIGESYDKYILTPLEISKKYFSNLSDVQKESVQNTALEAGKTLLDNLVNLLQSFVEYVPNLLGALPGIFAGLLFISLATFFLTKDYEKIKSSIRLKLTDKQLSNIRIVMNEIKKTAFGFVKAQATMVSMTFAIVLIGLLVLRVKYAFILSVIIGFVDLLPYVGTGLIFIPWAITLFTLGDSGLAIALIILYVIIVVQRNIVEPKILSSNIGLDPLSTLIAIYLGFKFFGVIGLIIGPVTLIIIKMIYKISEKNKEIQNKEFENTVKKDNKIN